MSDGDDDTKVRLSAIFRHVVRSEDGPNSLFLKALDDEGSTRCSLLDLSHYNAFKDGFLLRPALESMYVSPSYKKLRYNEADLPFSLTVLPHCQGKRIWKAFQRS